MLGVFIDFFFFKWVSISADKFSKHTCCVLLLPICTIIWAEAYQDLCWSKQLNTGQLWLGDTKNTSHISFISLGPWDVWGSLARSADGGNATCSVLTEVFNQKNQRADIRLLRWQLVEIYLHIFHLHKEQKVGINILKNKTSTSWLHKL